MNALADDEIQPSCRDCGPGYRLGDEGCRHGEYQPEPGETGICRTCVQPIESGRHGNGGAMSQTAGEPALVDLTLYAVSGRIDFEDDQPSIVWGDMADTRHEEQR